jgi:hypothetical protein
MKSQVYEEWETVPHSAVATLLLSCGHSCGHGRCATILMRCARTVKPVCGHSPSVVQLYCGHSVQTAILLRSFMRSFTVCGNSRAVCSYCRFLAAVIHAVIHGVLPLSRGVLVLSISSAVILLWSFCSPAVIHAVIHGTRPPPALCAHTVNSSCGHSPWSISPDSHSPAVIHAVIHGTRPPPAACTHTVNPACGHSPSVIQFSCGHSVLTAIVLRSFARSFSLGGHSAFGRLFSSAVMHSAQSSRAACPRSFCRPTALQYGLNT